MKKLTLTILIALHCSLFTIHLFSQPCLPEGITFTNQAQIDNFQINYPNCTEIEGDVYIWGDDIINVDGLSILTAIGGNLGIGVIEGGGNGIPNLNSLEGFGNLITVEGNVDLYANFSLVNFSGLENLVSIGEHLGIEFSSALTSLTGLDNLVSIGGYLRIEFSNALTSLTGLENLISIGGKIEIWGNESLNSLTGLTNLTSIGGGFSIRDNDALLSLIGMDNIEAASIHDLHIVGNDSLSTCDVQSICDYLVSPNGIVDIRINASGCDNPQEIAGICGITLPCLPYGNYYFYTQEQIDNFQTDFPGCTEIEGDVIINGNDITNLNGLNVITSISGDLIIESNSILNSLTGLENLINVEGNLIIGKQPMFGNGNPSLSSLTGLNNLTTIGGSLRIDQNNALTSLTGLESLTSIEEGNLLIGSGSTSWGNGGNASLTSLEGLGNIDANSISGVFILYNTSLNTCDVEGICDYLALPNAIVEIYNNAPGCNSQEEVEEACWTSVDERSYSDKLIIYPNPFSKIITIEFELKQPEIFTITIYNHLCSQVEAIAERKSVGQQKIEWNSEGLPAGIYFCVLKTNDGIQTRKIIKL